MVRRITNFLYKNQGYVDSYDTMKLQGESVLRKLSIVAILLVGLQAQATSGDCYMTNSCTGSPAQQAPSESAFSAQNLSNIVSVFAQVASAAVSPSSNETSGFNPLSSTLTENTQPSAPVTVDPYDDTAQ